ncbi:uncharacterized protein [Argopecten irradians]|uniref:uncharacterized protein n=1 Tax=Argopecten irradians TaxID=31199 RepID=UPI0037134DC0
MTPRYLAIFVMLAWIGQSSGYEQCVGQFYQTHFNSVYGRYSIGTNDRQIYYNWVDRNYSPKYCPDRCCTIKEGHIEYYYRFPLRYPRTYSYKTCCYSYVPVTPSYKPSGKTESRKGLIIGCAIGGTMFTVVTLCSLVVARVMWIERKRIEPTSTPDESLPTVKDSVAMVNIPEPGACFAKSEAKEPTSDVTMA